MILLRLEDETEKEKLEREAQGLGTLTSDDAKLFRLEMVVSNNHLESSDSKLAEVLYIENIMFLLQTIKINFQFTHFMRCVSFAQDIADILNKSVHQVHYIHLNQDEQGLIKNRVYQSQFTPQKQSFNVGDISDISFDQANDHDDSYLLK